MRFPLLAEYTLQKDLLGFRFGVFFFHFGVVPNQLDIRFQKVSGLTAKVETQSQPEGGQNLYAQRLPTGIRYDNLVLKRGLVVGSLLNLEFNAAMTLFKFRPSNVLVTLFNEKAVPVSAWFFFKAFPVRWSTSDLDADSKGIVIDTMELAYARMQALRI